MEQPCRNVQYKHPAKHTSKSFWHLTFLPLSSFLYSWYQLLYSATRETLHLCNATRNRSLLLCKRPGHYRLLPIRCCLFFSNLSCHLRHAPKVGWKTKKNMKTWTTPGQLTYLAHAYPKETLCIYWNIFIDVSNVSYVKMRNVTYKLHRK